MIGPSGPATQGIITSSRGTLTDYSGSITTGGTAQTPLPANSNRVYLLIQNTSTDDLYFNFTATAITDSPSVLLKSGEALVMESTFVSTEAISIIGATTGQTFTIKEGSE